MLSIKLTPFILFLIILVVLVISIIFGNWFSSREGFISFAGDKRTLDKVSIPQYSKSKPVYKLDDNLFFDYTNGNLIELDAAALSGTTYDSTGVTIKNVLITSRDNGQTTIVPIDASSATVDTGLSKLSAIPKSKSYLKYPSQCKNTTKTYTIYSAWDDDTYISVFTNDSSGSWSVTNNFYFDETGVASADHPSATGNTFINGVANDTDANNNKLVTEPLYSSSKQVYQLSKYVKFDPTNGNLIVITNGAAVIYDRNKTTITNSNLASSVPKVGFAPWYVVDSTGQKIVLYLANGQNTVVSLVGFSDNSKAELTLANQKRFTKNGLDSDSVSGTTDTSDSSGNSGSSLPATQPDSVISEYFKWYWYWKSSASSTDNNNDYILKTQIVPPVCPSCPGCASSSGSASCTNCGGQGGSGTLTATGKSIFDASGNATSCINRPLATIVYDSSRNPLTCASVASGVASTATAVTAVGTAAPANKANSSTNGDNGVGGVVNNAVNTVGGVASNVVGAVGNVAGDVVTTAGSIVNTAANDITGLLTQGGQAAAGTGTGTGSDQSAEFINPKQSGLQRNTYYGTQNQTSDKYSYNGQLPSKAASNFLPITADFSAFGK